MKVVIIGGVAGGAGAAHALQGALHVALVRAAEAVDVGRMVV